MKTKILVTILLAIFGLSIKAQSTVDTCRLKIGINLSDPTNYDTEQPFVDIMKNCFYWKTDTTTNIDLDTLAVDAVPKDANGYPLQIHYVYNTIPYKVCTWMSVTQNHGTNIKYPSGTYIVLYEGTGVLKFGSDAQAISQTQTLGTTRIVLNVTPSNAGILMQIVSSSFADHIRNIRVLMPGTEFTYLSSPFNPAFLNKLTPFPVLRFMEWGGIDNNTTQKWSDRTTMNSYTQASYEPYVTKTKIKKGCAYEYMIKLCNVTQKDMWICVPHMADSIYITNLAKLIRDSLNPNLKIYLEYSNEVFNLWDFKQYKWVDTTKLAPQGLSHVQKTAYFANRIFTMWYNVFGTQAPTRIIRVAAGFTFAPNVADSMMIYLKSIGAKADAISCAPYFGNDPVLVYDSLKFLGANATATDVVRFARKDLEFYVKDGIRKHNQIALKDSVRLLFYEGGQHVLPNQGDTFKYNKAVYAAQSDIGMYTLYKDFIKFIKDSTKVDLFMHFTLASGWDSLTNPIGPFGSIESVYQDTSIDPAPKYKALINYINSCQITGINEITKNPDFVKVFPNPSTGIFSVVLQSNPSKPEIEIYNMLGEKIYHRYFYSDKTEINLSQQPKGMYFYKVLSEGKFISSGKLIVQ